MDWDDLRCVLAVAETGSLAGAAPSLGVNHATVLRRITASEKRPGARLNALTRAEAPDVGGANQVVEAQ